MKFNFLFLVRSKNRRWLFFSVLFFGVNFSIVMTLSAEEILYVVIAINTTSDMTINQNKSMLNIDIYEKMDFVKVDIQGA